MNKTIHIEICKSEWKPNAWNIRIGDIRGSSESSNISESDMILEIEEAIVELREENNQSQEEQMGDNVHTTCRDTSVAKKSDYSAMSESKQKHTLPDTHSELNKEILNDYEPDVRDKFNALKQEGKL